MNYIKIFLFSQALSVLVRNIYSEDQLMHIFLDNFHPGVKCTSHLAIHQSELRREETFTDQKYLSITSIDTGYLNIYSSSVYGRNNER